MPRDWPWRFEARVRRIVDADTLDLAVDVGFSVDVRARIRVADIDAPETKTPEGKAATVWAETLLAASPWVVVETEFDRTFDRYVGRISLADGTDYATRLLEAGHAKRWPA